MTISLIIRIAKITKLAYIYIKIRWLNAGNLIDAYSKESSDTIKGLVYIVSETTCQRIDLSVKWFVSEKSSNRVSDTTKRLSIIRYSHQYIPANFNTYH